MIKKILISLISLLLLVSCSSNSPKEFKIEDKDFSLLEYVHYIPDDFNVKCEEMINFADNNDFEKVKELYDFLYSETLKVMDYDSISFINYSEDVNNQELKDENVYAEDVARKVKNVFNTACNKITLSPCADEFKKFLNNDYVYEDYVNYKEKSQELLDLETEESKLQKEYSVVSNNIYNSTVEYNGKEYSFNDLLSGDLGVELYNSDHDKYYELYNDFNKRLNTETGEIFLKQIKIRDQIAKLYGYDNYALYADDLVYCRDYNADDLKYLKQYTKEFGYQILLAYYLFSNNENIDLNSEDLIDAVVGKVRTFSPVLEQSADIFLDNHLYSISSSDNRYDGSFESSMYHNHSGFIFLNCGNYERDYFTLAHEFGHFTNSIAVEAPNPSVKDGCYDIFEIHSTGLEMLFGLKSQEIFDEDRYLEKNVFNLADKLSTLIEACTYDDWQRAVYENPDMSLEEINKLFVDTYLSYGYKDFIDDYGFPELSEIEYNWNYVPHNFDNPMYYISYGTSSFAALQIFNEAYKDFDKGVKIWENIALNDSYNKGYLQVVEEAGLTPFTNEESVAELFASLFTYIADSYDAIYDE